MSVQLGLGEHGELRDLFFFELRDPDVSTTVQLHSGGIAGPGLAAVQ